jgi:hypothetical protein
MSPQILGIMVPIIAIVMGVGTAIIAILAGHRQRMQRNELRHRERLAAIEKGLEIPPDPVESEPVGRRPRYLLRGLCCLFFGATLTAAMWQVSSDVPYLFGLIPAAIGAGYLLFYFIEGRHEAKLLQQSGAGGSSQGV